MTMKIVDFVRRNQESILADWDAFALTQLPAAENMNFGQLRDHAAQILNAIAHDMEVAQSSDEQAAKSKGGGLPQRMTGVATIHADLRVNFGFTIEQLLAEFRALRASILNLWSKHGHADIEGMVRFNETIDEAIAESVHRYAKVTADQRNTLLSRLTQELGSASQAVATVTKGLKGADRNEDRARLLDTLERNAELIVRSTEELRKLTNDRVGAATSS